MKEKEKVKDALFMLPKSITLLGIIQILNENHAITNDRVLLIKYFF